MSWAATGYVKRLRRSPTGEPITKPEKLLLFVLADYHNEDRGDAWASLTHLAQESLHTRSGVVRTLRRLEEKGVLVIVRDPHASMKRVTNRYRFADLDGSPVPAVDRPVPAHGSPVELGVSEADSTRLTSDHGSPALVTAVHQTGDHGSPALVTTGHHIFPKNLSTESFQRHTGQVFAHAEEVLGALNARAGRSYQARHPNGEPTANLQVITALLRKGYAPEQLLSVVEDRVRRWRDDPDLRQYLRPETLFGLKKFTQYLGQVGSPARPPTSTASVSTPRIDRGELVSAPEDFREMIQQAKQKTNGVGV